MRSFRTLPSVSPAHPKSTPERDDYLYRTHKVALDPTPDEERLLTHTADYYRAAYNWGLRCYLDEKKDEKKDGKKAKKELTKETLQSKWNAIKGSKYPWGKRMSQKVADYAFDALIHAIRAGENPHLKNTAPRFHSKTRHTTFRIGDRNDRVHCQGQYIELPRIGKIRMCEPLRLSGSLQKVTIKREAGRWFACLAVKVQRVERPDRPGRAPIGVDVGIRNMLVCSDGTVYEQYPSDKTKRRVKYQERKIRRFKKQLACQILGSARRQRLALRLQEARYRIKRARDDSQHKAATEIVDGASAVGSETLNALGMTQGTAQRSPGQLSGAAMIAMLSKLEDRCEDAGIKLTKADPFFPSSQLCSGCGRGQKMPMGKKEYRCPCGLVLDRDFNAAVNLEPPADAAA